jgi:hypothetical protein
MTRTLLHFLNAGGSVRDALQIGPAPVVFAFAAALSLVTALLFGVAPAWQSTRVSLTPGLKEQAGNTRGYPTFRKLLVIAQIALSVVILVGTGLLTKTLRTLQTIDLGFQQARVIVLSVDPSMSGYSHSAADSFYKELLDRVRRIPQVASASLAVSTPMDGTKITMQVEVPGYAARNRENSTPVFNVISPNYFATLSEVILEGRDFTGRDTSGAPGVATSIKSL